MGGGGGAQNCESTIHFGGGGGRKLTDHVAIGNSEGEGVGGRCAPSRAEHERKFYFFLEDSTFFGGLIVC